MKQPTSPYSSQLKPRTRFEGHELVAHRHSHTDPSHHIGPCTSNDRAGRSSHVHREGRHIYDGPSSRGAKADFTRRYGKRKGAYVYGATIGKIKRAQLAARRVRVPSYKMRRGATRRGA